MSAQPKPHRRSNTVVAVMALLCICAGIAPVAWSQGPTETVVIDSNAPAHPFPHFWEQMFGSGRAILSLRDSYRQDLRSLTSATAARYVRFHAIFHDEVGIYDEDPAGKPVFNFSYVDQIYDGLLAEGVKPFVELSFMPAKLSSQPPVFQAFWYKPIVSPPGNWSKWDDLISHFAQHLVQRYGIEEVSQWYFEVWNEPNLDFWAGDPKEETYYRLYDETAKTLKSVDPRLRVGGPATAQAAWVDRFIRHTADAHTPVDFVSTHVYGNDSAPNVFGTDEQIPRTEMVCRAVRKVHDQVKSSARPDLPLIWSEYNASYMTEPAVTDSTFMGPWLADTIRQCDGLVDMLSYWTFSDVFEEQGVVRTPFYGGYGLIAEDNIPKPAFNAFRLLHRLGNQRIDADSTSTLVTRTDAGSLAVAVWNLRLPEQPGHSKEVLLEFKGIKNTSKASVSRVDADHGSVMAAYEAMGKPAYPTKAQIKKLQDSAVLPPPKIMSLHEGKLQIILPPDGLALVELR